MTPLEELTKRLAGGETQVRCTGLVGSSKAYLLSRLLGKETKKAVVYLAPSSKEASQIQNDLEFFGIASEFFLPHDAFPFTPLSSHLDVTCQRMGILARLLKKQCRVIVTTPTAIATFLPPSSVFQKVLLEYSLEVDRTALIRRLSEWGYEKVTLVTDRGTFAVRGALLDLFPSTEERPIRVEWIGDLIESIRIFDPRSQKTIDPIDRIEIAPAREIVLGKENFKNFQQAIRSRAETEDIPKSYWGPLLEKIGSEIYFSGIETYLPFFYEKPATFFDYLSNPLVIVDDPSAVSSSLQSYLDEVNSLCQSLEHPLITLQEVINQNKLWENQSGTHLELVPFGGPDTLSFPIETHNLRSEIKKSSQEPLAPIARAIKGWLETDRVILVASSETQRSRLQDLLSPYFPTPFPFEIKVGLLATGFRDPAGHLTYLTDEEIFGPRIHRPQKSSSWEGLSSLAEIKLGDPLVHTQHGIGLYRGMTPMTIDGITNDFLLIEYRGEDKLYLPIYRLNLIQKYTGGDGAPRLDKLGGTSWITIRQKAEKTIRQIAGDLLNLYAARTAGKGFAFSPPNEMFEAFEASFPYEETPDQERAIAETLADMQHERPMDRLILGDVGYGKTEVAMRAAYKAALDGKQTAILVPTTLLAFQHAERFAERFRDTPVRIEMLSRFRPRAEQKRVLQEMALGNIDIVIGTHRLLQPDISFKNLGLLVIDEEHRFGVSHKEKIKHLRKNVDALTLSATPIPRTLYMSLVGIRGVSIIETPPTDRLAIRTFVMPFQDSVIREAISREIKRGGQVFFLHNNIQTMGKMKEFLEKLIPEAKCEIAHGQMEEEGLEEIMIRFYHQEFNLLLCTTIIESGIDIPTANTILINEADRFGLAQIYQLRGRVGRGAHRAYAYLLIAEDKELTPEATQRLQVLQKFSELGTGFRMANYDLEIRGAGNLLGREQSGQMTAIGYELYSELLEQAVRELKGEKVLEEIDPELHFKLPAYIPESYLPDPPLRLELYRRLSSLDSEDEIEPILDELRDRFGKPPVEVENLLELSAVKTYAKRLRLKQIRYDGRNFSYAFDPTSPLPPEVLTEMIKKDPKVMKLTPDLRLIIHKPVRDDHLLMETKKFLRELTIRVQ
ncbi:MAG: transcription-repair coupling factor [Deltaproteobacteria bacterium]|nr:transcription-repair coupling factor [Deltaproteobacteria bacterium]